MPRSRQHPNAASGGDQHGAAIDLHHDFSRQHIEKLLRFVMIVANLGRARRNEFFNHAELFVLDQVPAIAIVAPAVMFGIFATDGCGLSHVCSPPGFQCNLERMKSEQSADLKRLVLRHTVATLAYRAEKATRDVPANFAEFNNCEGARTPAQILAHIGDLLDWGLSIAKGKQVWHDSKPMLWDQERTRLFTALEKFDEYLASAEPLHAPVENLFQGPIADALTHVGQIALLRRMAAAPIRPENYFQASVEVGRVGAEQKKPKREF